MKKNTKITFSRSFSILAAAALSMTLIGGQTFPAYAENSSGIESGAVIPDNITIDSPTALRNIALPSNSYGTLSWVDGSYIPEKRVQSCEVVFKPSTSADLSGLPGWDSASGTITGYVTVVVSSLDSTSEEYVSDEDRDSYEYEESDEKNTSDSDEDSSDTSDKETVEEDNSNESGDQKDTSEDSSAVEDQNKEDTDSSGDKDGQNTDGQNKSDQKPQIMETPEATATPAGEDDTPDNEKPEVTETPEVSTTPAADDSTADSDPADSKADNKDDAPEVTETPNTTEIPEITEKPEDNKDNIFDRKDDAEDKRPQNAATDLTDAEKAATAVQNHTCDGITVSGIDLPWYVQFRVSGGDDYQFTNEEDAAIFKSYEFELWDTQKNTEYEIPDGEYISVTVPVKAGYTYSIEHLLDNGAMETIIPSVDGDTMTFSTHSFSPFGIAGSKSLVGPDAGSDSSVTVTPAADISSTDTGAGSSTDTSNDSGESTDEMDTSKDLSSGTAELTDSSSQNGTESSESEDQSSQAKSKKQVNTGDDTDSSFCNSVCGSGSCSRCGGIPQKEKEIKLIRIRVKVLPYNETGRAFYACKNSVVVIITVLWADRTFSFASGFSAFSV